MAAYQNWETVVVKRKHAGRSSNVPASYAAARGPTMTVARTKDVEQKALHRKVDEAEEAHRIQSVSKDTSHKIRDARNAKGWTQKEFAQKLNIQQKVVAEYENGSAVPDNQLLGKFERVLGVKLRGTRKKQ